MVEKISIQIALEGVEQVKRDLAGISDAGQKAFEDISAAAAKAGGFDKLDPTLVARKFNQFGVTASQDINKITNALQSAGRTETLVTGIQNMERGLVRVSAAATRAGTAFGLTRREIGALRIGLRQLELGGIGGQFAALGRVGAAFGPIGIGLTAIATALAGAVIQTFKFAEAINKANAESIKLGASFAQFDKLRASMEAAGFSLKGISEGLGQFKKSLDDLQLQQVGKDLEFLQNRFDRGVRFAPGANVEQLQRLQEAARGIGPAAEAARAGLEKLRLLQPFPALDQQMKQIGTDLPKFLELLDQIPTEFQKVQAATQFFGKALGTDVIAALPQFIAVLERLPDSMARTQLAIKFLGETLGVEVIKDLQAGGAGLERFKQKVDTTLTQEDANKATQLEQSTNRLEGALSRLGTVVLGPGLATAIDGITTSVQNLNQALATDPWAVYSQAAIAALNPIGFVIAKIIQQIFNLSSALRSSGTVEKPPELGTPQAGEGFAAGGIIGGRGTGTSDSNLAWVSRGEHIMPAQAVGQPGVLAFLEALRRSGGNLSRVLDGMGRFALGGLVPASRMAFAAGGPVGSMSNVTIQFPGVPPISGLRASSAVVDELRKTAALAQVRSGGRKPSRYS